MSFELMKRYWLYLVLRLRSRLGLDCTATIQRLGRLDGSVQLPHGVYRVSGPVDL